MLQEYQHADCVKYSTSIITFTFDDTLMSFMQELKRENIGKADDLQLQIQIARNYSLHEQVEEVHRTMKFNKAKSAS